MINLIEKTMPFDQSITINDLFEEFINNEDNRIIIAKKIDDKLLDENFDLIKCNAILAKFFTSREFGEVGFDQIDEMIKKLFFNGFYPDASNLEKFTQANFKIAVLNSYYSNQTQEMKIEDYVDFYQTMTVKNDNLEPYTKSIIDGIDYYDYCLAHDEEFNKKHPLLINYNNKILGFSANQLCKILSADIKIKELNHEKSFREYTKKNRIYGHRIREFKKLFNEQSNILRDVKLIRHSIECQSRAGSISNDRFQGDNSSESHSRGGSLSNEKNLPLKSDFFRNSGSIEIPINPNLPTNYGSTKSPNCFTVFCRTIISCFWRQNMRLNSESRSTPSSTIQNPAQTPSSLQSDRRDVMLE